MQDICTDTSLSHVQDEDEVVVQTPEITQRVHHATDEEKLASTCMMGQTTDSQQEREEPECNKAPAKKQLSSDPVIMDGKLYSDICTDMAYFCLEVWVFKYLRR